MIAIFRRNEKGEEKIYAWENGKEIHIADIIDHAVHDYRLATNIENYNDDLIIYLIDRAVCEGFWSIWPQMNGKGRYRYKTKIIEINNKPNLKT